MAHRAVDVFAEPDAFDRIRTMGFTAVPVVVVGDRGVNASNLAEVAAFFGQAYERPPRLSPPALFERFDLVLDAARRYVAQVPDERLSFRFPERDRTFGGLAYHVFSIPRFFVDGRRSGDLTARTLMEVSRPPDAVTTGLLLAHGAATQQRLRDWWEHQGRDADYDEELETYQGRRTLHEAFERETWHSAQHTRQLLLFMAHMGIEPDRPLTDEDLAGLPLPNAVWDDR